MWLGAPGLCCASIAQTDICSCCAAFDELQKECGPGCPRDRWESWRTASAVGYGLLAAGGLSAGVGLFFLLWRPRVAEARGLAWEPLGAGGLSLRGAF